MKYAKYVVVAVLAALLFATMIDEGKAQAPACLPVDKAVAMLAEKHGEMPIAAMKDSNGLPLRLWANLETGSFTLFFLRGDEAKTEACLVTAGGNFRVGR